MGLVFNQYKTDKRYQKDNKDGLNTIFNFYYQDDDTFQVVDNTKIKAQKTMKRFQNRGFQNLRQHQGSEHWIHKKK